jgi:hypothetical protein
MNQTRKTTKIHKVFHIDPEISGEKSLRAEHALLSSFLRRFLLRRNDKIAVNLEEVPKEQSIL